MKYEDALDVYFSMRCDRDLPHPDREHSREIDGNWVLANTNGPLAVVTTAGKSLKVDEVMLAMVSNDRDLLAYINGVGGAMDALDERIKSSSQVHDTHRTS